MLLNKLTSARSTTLGIFMRVHILSVSPQALEEMEKLEETNIDHATDYLLGSGATSLPKAVWEKVQTRFVAHLPYLLMEHVKG